MSETVQSADGTVIAYDRRGHGPAVVISGGTLGDRSQQADVAELLGNAGFTTFNFDRRGRGETVLKGPYVPEREYEDLDAVIKAAGGAAFVYGTSGPGVMALLAAAQELGSTIDRLVLWEPPFILEGTRPVVPADYQRQLESMLAQGRRGDMVELFLTVAVGMPNEFVASMRQMPFWPAQEAFAHTLVYDATMMGDYSLPRERISRVQAPTLVVDGGQTPWLTATADAVAAAIPNAQRRTVPGQPHNVDASAIAPVIIEFFRS